MDRLANHDDANLILRLYELRREETMRKARNWFVANYYCNSFAESMQLCPMGSEENAYFRMVVSYWDMVASFITSGVLNEELYFQSGGELLLTWVRVKPVVGEIRAAFGNPNAWKNLEEVGARFKAYWDRVSPGAYEAFVTRMGSRPAAQAQAHKAE